MPPRTRSTANLRILESTLRSEVRSRGKALESDLPSTEWRDILNAVADTMMQSPHVHFYRNDGNGNRSRVTEADERCSKLARFLKRSVPGIVPNIADVNVSTAGTVPWFRSVDATPGNPDADNEPRPDDAPPSPSPQPDGDNDAEAEQDADAAPADAPDPTPPPDATPEQLEQFEIARLDNRRPADDTESEFHKWWRILARLRRYCRDSAQHGLPIDDLDSYRPVVMGAKMIRMGITADACADACTAHWPDDARDEMQVHAVDPASLFPPNDGEHPSYQYVLRLLRAGVPVMLHGGAGVGKTTLARDIATQFDLDFGMVSMTAGLSTTALTGSVNLQGFVTRPCIDTFTNGGVFLFDEMDAADANLLLICNTMLANDEFQSPVTGERHIRHPRWYPIAAVNTLNGATTSYTGRTKLDHATMDRWRMGRVRLDFLVDNALQYGLAALNG